MSANAQLSAFERRTNPDTYGTIAPPTTFLSLAPTTSSSYPTHRRSSSTAEKPVEAVDAAAASAASNESAIIEEPAANSTTIANPIAGEIAVALTNRTRRTSSMTSSGSNGMRFLKLGPIHGWEDHSAVWSEVVE